MQIVTMGNAQTMSSREIADLTEKRHDNVMRDIRAMLQELGLDVLKFEGTYLDGSNRVQTVFLLPRDLTDCLLTGYSAVARMRVIQRWRELEAKQAPTLPQTYIEALEQLLTAKKAEQLAIETKAQIGHRREATAMNTASQAVKKVAKLEIELDKSKQYATVKRMEMIYHGQRFDWRRLKSTATEIGTPPIDVFDQNYGTVKSYHADVWAEAYALAIE